MDVPMVEKTIGIEIYATHSLGIGGVIRKSVEDFTVEEVLVDGSKAKIRSGRKLIKENVLGSSYVKNNYLLCVLVKRNWDTILAVRNLARQLGVSSMQIHIAGMKDAKAITAQHVSVEGATIEDVQKVRIKDIAIRPAGYVYHKLSTFYLFGNIFHINIKDVTHTKSTIRKRVTKIIDEIETVGGVPNFFGHQRFGTTRPITHLVGKAIIQGDYEKAAMLFLANPSPYEHPDSSKARRQLQTTGDFQKAFKIFPKQLLYERLMLKHLARKPSDFQNAFRRLPVRLRMLFTQAYQSYLFNRFLSKRIKDGLELDEAEVGDYVISVDHSGLPMPTMSRKVSLANLADINKLLQLRRMRLALPLVGFKQRTSEGIQGSFERRILEEEKIMPDDFKTVDMPEASNRGEMRAAITPVIDFSLKTVSCRKSLKRTARTAFLLQRGSYATVLLRELMKHRSPVKAGF